MTSRRLLKAAEAIREVVSTAILVDLRDPRVQNVTVTKVAVAPDMRSAKVYVSVMGNEKQQQLSLRGLESSAGFLQKKVGNRIETRYVPRLQFVLDQGVKHSIAVAEILREVLPSDQGDESDLQNDEASQFVDDAHGDKQNDLAGSDDDHPNYRSGP